MCYCKYCCFTAITVPCFQFNIAIPILFLIAVLFLLVVPLFAAPKDTGMGLLLVLTGLPVYLIGVRWKNKPKAFTNFVSKYTFLSTVVYIVKNNSILQVTLVTLIRPNSVFF